MCLKHRTRKGILPVKLDRVRNVTVRAMENDETAHCTQEEICAFARKPHNNVTGREFLCRPSEYVHVQKEHPWQRGNDISEKNKAAK